MLSNCCKDNGLKKRDALSGYDPPGPLNQEDWPQLPPTAQGWPARYSGEPSYTPTCYTLLLDYT